MVRTARGAFDSVLLLMLTLPLLLIVVGEVDEMAGRRDRAVAVGRSLEADNSRIVPYPDLVQTRWAGRRRAFPGQASGWGSK
jgi:hypothetical protein